MNTRTVSPSKRLAMAGLGYLLIYLGPMWIKGGAVAMLAAAVLYAVFALLLLRIAAPGLLSSGRSEDEIHPVQAGKQPLLRRGRPAAWSRA